MSFAALVSAMDTQVRCSLGDPAIVDLASGERLCPQVFVVRELQQDGRHSQRRVTVEVGLPEALRVARGDFIRAEGERMEVMQEVGRNDFGVIFLVKVLQAPGAANVEAYA